MIVADANLVLYLLIDGPHTNTAEAIFQRDPDWLFPMLCRSEIRQAVVRLTRAGRLTGAHAARILKEAARLIDGHEVPLPDEPVRQAAMQSGCSAYDCEYVVLARATGVPLLTFDIAVRKAFPDHCQEPSRFVGDA